MLEEQPPLLEPEPNSDFPVSTDELSDLRVLCDALPPAVDLSALLDRRVRITRADGAVTVSEGGRVWVVVGINQRIGIHRLPDVEVRAAASQRPGGPIAIGSTALQWLLDVGEHALLGEYVLYVVARGASGVSYAIVDREIWRGEIRSPASR